jgi:hypothetical protein
MRSEGTEKDQKPVVKEKQAPEFNVSHPESELIQKYG